MAMLQLLVEHENFTYDSLFFFQEWRMGDKKKEKEKKVNEYLGPWVLWLTEIKGSLAVSLDPESVIVCLWGHKEATEPCTVRQKNTEKWEQARPKSLTPKMVALHFSSWGGNSRHMCPWLTRVFWKQLFLVAPASSQQLSPSVYTG